MAAAGASGTVSMGRYEHQIRPALSRISQDHEIPLLGTSRNAVVFLFDGLPFAGKTLVCHLVARHCDFELVTVEDEGSLLLQIAKAVGRWRRRGSFGVPGVVVDSLRTDDGLGEVLSFFRPRPALFEVECEEGIRRKRIEEFDSRKWAANKDELLGAEELAAERLVRVRTLLSASNRQRPITTTHGVTQLTSDISKRFGMYRRRAK